MFLLYHEIPLNESCDLVGIFMCRERVNPRDEHIRFVAYAEQLATMCDWNKHDLLYTSAWETVVETNGFKLKTLFPRED